MKRKHYTDEQEQVFLDRAHKYLAKNPSTSRGKLAIYSGVGVSVLERLENEGKITLPPKLTIQQARATSPWAKGNKINDN
jgi:hypothetical protein|tara:strand:- start:3214 stop:3453 length:240 start_codon:yes stop_codon:yes gene_type:complete